MKMMQKTMNMLDETDSQDKGERFSLNTRVEEVEKKLNIMFLNYYCFCNNSDKCQENQARTQFENCCLFKLCFYCCSFVKMNFILVRGLVLNWKD